MACRAECQTNAVSSDPHKRKSTPSLKAGPFIVMLIFLVWPAGALAQYGGGSGTIDDPVQIYTGAQFNTIGTNPADWNKHFSLCADIDLSEFSNHRFNPIGSRWGLKGYRPFTGVFNGNGHTISNLTFRTEDRYSVGLFAYVAYAQIKNLSLTDPSIRAPNANHVGALIGFLGSGTVSNCAALNARIVASGSGGGLIGENDDGVILGCSCTGDIHAENGSAGGLVGCSERGQISDCHASCSVTCDYDVGGLIGDTGYSSSTTITACYASGTVMGTNRAGGFIGRNFRGRISHCYSTSTVQGERFVGGFCGHNYGYNYGIIQFCYATGSVTGGEFTAGFTTGGTLYQCLWDIESSGIQSGDGIGKTTSELQQAESFRGWGTEGRWTLDQGIDYPHLSWEDTAGSPLIDPVRHYSGGAGKPNEPYRIQTAEGLLQLSIYAEDWSKHFVLVNDIDLSTLEANDFQPIGVAAIPFDGSFDGQGHKILNLGYHNKECANAGLFGSTTSTTRNLLAEVIGTATATIKNLHLELANVVGADNTGILVGTNGAIIEDCSVTGAITGTEYTGGLVGYNSGSIRGCHALVDVTGEAAAGGLVGHNDGQISACSSDGSVLGSAAGGLVGHNDGHLEASLSHSSVSGQSAGGLVGISGEAGYWQACPAPPPSFVPLLSDAKITACYSTGAVAGDQEAGGLVGANSGSIMACYAAGPDHGTSPGPYPVPDRPPVNAKQALRLGGLVGVNRYGIIYSSFWDTDVSTIPWSDGGRGKNTGQLFQAQTFAGWDYFQSWRIDPGQSYPRLSWENTPGQDMVADPNRYAGGLGTNASPYQIGEPEHLINLGRNPGDWNKHFVMVNDLDLSEVDPNEIYPIGSKTVPFTGTLDGNHRVISHYRSRNPSNLYVGLFGYLGRLLPRGTYAYPNHMKTRDPNEGRVFDLSMTDVDISGFCYVGCLAGYNIGTVTGCSISGSIQGYGNNLGGGVGYNKGDIVDCQVACTVTYAEQENRGLGSSGVAGTLTGCNAGSIVSCSGIGSVSMQGQAASCAGGLVGENGGLALLSCSHFEGDVNGLSTVGGLVALNHGTILKSSAQAIVAGSAQVGGLVGYNDYGSAIDKSFSNSVVMGENTVGGLVGTNGGTIQYCFAQGEVKGQNHVGGLVGYDRESILYAYSVCTVEGQTMSAGLIGGRSKWADDIVSCFWDLETSLTSDGLAAEDPDPNGIQGLPTTDMQTPGPYLAAGWDFVGETENGTDDIWFIMSSPGYPRLTWESGTNPEGCVPEKEPEKEPGKDPRLR